MKPVAGLPLLLSLSTLLPLAHGQQVNLASVGTATQSSQYGSAGYAYSMPENAIDGGGSAGEFFDGDCSCTNSTVDSWWRVDLGGTFHLSEVHLYNRTDCCPTRLSNFRLSVEDAGVEVWTQDYYVGTGHVPAGGEHITLPAGLLGDAVQVRLLGFNNDGNGYLTIAEVEVHGDAIGTTYCSPANANSTGLPGVLHAVGSPQLSGPLDFGVVASDLPPNQFGYMLCSLTKGSVVPPGSQGVLCLSGEIGRFKKQVESTDGGGVLGIVVDTAHLPLNPPRAIVAGETWHFQAWYRDGGSSNFTDAVSVSFL